MEPVKGFLGRYLRRRLVEAEVMTSLRNNDLNKIIDWVPKVWLHLNKFLETHSSSDVTIGLYGLQSSSINFYDMAKFLDLPKFKASEDT